MIDPTFRTINRLFGIPLEVGDFLFKKFFWCTLHAINRNNYFNVLIDNKPFLINL